MAYILDKASQNAYTQEVERLHEMYSGAAAAVLIEQLHSPFVSTPWVTGAVIGVITITAIILFINFLAFKENNEIKNYAIKYDQNIDGLTAAVPDELFEECFEVMLEIQQKTDDITEVEKTLKKPMMPFLKDEVLSQLERLRKERGKLNDRKTELYQQISQAIEQQREVKDTERKVEYELKNLKE